MLLVIVVDVLLLVIYQLNFIIGLYVHEKKVLNGVCNYLWFWLSTVRVGYRGPIILNAYLDVTS